MEIYFSSMNFLSSIMSILIHLLGVQYGALVTDCFKEFHRRSLVEAAKEGKEKYVVRPALSSGCESKSGPCRAIGTRDSLNLGGFGVELALKNMEYKGVDDSELKKGMHT